MNRFQQLQSADYGPLLAWVEELAPHACSRHGERVDIPTDRVDDVVGDVVLKLVGQGPQITHRLLERNPTLDPASDSAEHILTRYVRTMLGNRWLGVVRKEKRHTQLDPKSEDYAEEPAHDVEKDQEANQTMAKARAALQEAVDRVLGTAGVNGPQFLDSVDQLLKLGRGQTTMWDLVDRELEKCPGPDQKTMRGRLQRRHSRARSYLRNVLGTLEPERAELVRGLLAAVLTRKKPSVRKTKPETSAEQESK